MLPISFNIYVVFPSFPFNTFASSVVFDAISVFFMSPDLPVVFNMAAFTGKKKGHYFQTDLATFQTYVTQPVSVEHL
jgi:hypothetical protein